ncbi:MAG: 1-acyl-sn-glycerol-3-phosphate acyltransferase [Candidatus Thiodiazotropha lotti]|uniref:Phospholipid/glycerol acyltransferase domain-containing protein n=1 Tax=Candidatus Thiodiazotropha endoloripes TaxID=1818881 RepID=A0A1E2URD7_9GAMM|nr:1-acyl-sn-glycerol-3-phosphate acyltransferase [Candidatus Thiodiazotropha endoloripes]MCG7897728.1 1-acyl-sn-glycerol-3-phosphate acyltransferase [Candidatus Thiodiazotropha weberae]MCG7990164.1 1-acyl-sn-glycerol-3-phosphate acyltransferase [Candidatus Thiodiazotropha lotti]MCG7902166.1 1-acyl-sn-glycerol-3-phosphate acyltransferase [Candidatus Thiodiazotropha weberae]MCG7999200.1 1-acyl-sn-glycerol-3-phosphate acyltransferase [Candidatus Thiodiazotropha lotti]MCW4181817.1 1-acyl-sn-glyce
MEHETLKGSGVTRLSWFEKIWQTFCRWVVKIFYRRFEVSGLENLPENQGIVLCANHVNALADPLVLQAATKKAIRPLARSGLFDNPLLRPVLQHIGAVPIYRRADPGVDVSKNTDTFEKCYGLLSKGETLIIFPEGQSHDDSRLSELKTGAARLALGTIDVTGVEPAVIPVGLTFPQKGQFRSAVLVQFGMPVELRFPENYTDEQKTNELTERIRQGLTSLTLNAESWEEIHLVNRIEQFFAMRHGKYHRRNLQQRFRAQQRIIDAQKLLRNYEPDRVRALIIQLKHFERICHYCGVKDYQLSIDYKPTLIVLYLLRMVGMLLIVFPIALWGMINSYIPYQITKRLTRRFARGTNQYDTTQMVLGLISFSAVWSLQVFLIFQYFGWQWTILYIVTLVISSAVLLMVRGEKQRIIENIRVFVLFLRKRDLKSYLWKKRQALEKELAKMVRIANRLSNH